MAHKCHDCKDTKIYQGLGAPEPCRSCLYNVEQRPPRLNHGSVDANGKMTFHMAGKSVLTDIKIRYKVDQAELMHLINQAVKTGENLDKLLSDNGKRWVTLVH